MSLRPNPSSSSSSQRKKVNKNTGVDAGDGCLRGQNDFVQIRKIKLLENILKKPKEEDDSSSSSPCLINTDQDILIFKIQHIRTLTQELFSDDPASQLEATTEIWKLLSKGHNALLIEEVIRAGVIPQLVKFLARYDIPQLQSKAACTLTSITSSEHTKIVVDNGAIPLLVHLLCCGSDDMKEQVLWVLGNISGDSPSTRDDVLNHGALLPLLGLIWNPTIVKPSILKIGSWTLSNLFHGKHPSTLLEQIQPALPFLRNLLLMTNEEVVVSACHALSFLTNEASSKMIQAVIDANVCPRLVELLRSPESKVTVSILKTLGSLAMGDEDHIQVLVDNGVLTCVKLLLSTHDKIILKHACWVISNITGGNKAPIQDIIDVDLISPLVHLTKAEFVIKKEVACAISNCAYGTPEQIRFLVSKGCIEALCDLLTCPDPTLMTLCLHGLYNILLDGDNDKNITGGVNVYAEKVDKCGGLEKIISLQSYDNDEVYTLAVDIVDTYWPEEHETVDNEKVHNSEQG